MLQGWDDGDMMAAEPGRAVLRLMSRPAACARSPAGVLAWHGKLVPHASR
jgi:hypothetical protein